MKSKRSLLAVILTICMIFSMVCSAAPIPVIVENASEVVASIDAEPQEIAEVMATVVPGKNILTGTTEAYTFDEGVVPSWLTSQFYCRNENLGAGYRVFLVADLNGGFNGDYYPVKIDVGSLDRPFYVSTSYRAVVDGSYPRSISTAYYRAVFADGTGAKIAGEQKTTTTATNYTKHEVISKGDDGVFRGTPEKPVTSIELRVLHEGGSGSKWKDYYDDIIVMPFYMVTYHNADGSVKSTEYVDPRQDSYTVASGSWTTTKDGTEKVTSVALNYADIDLYPYAEAPAEIVPGKNILTGTTGAYTFDAGIGTLKMVSAGKLSLADDNGNAVAKVAHTTVGYHDNVVLWENKNQPIDRPLYFSMKHRATTGYADRLLINFCNASGANVQQIDNGWTYPQNNNWKTSSGYMQNPTSDNSVTKILVHGRHIAEFADYYDDLVIMPAYKVTYYNADGTVKSTEYVDPRETTYTVASGSWTTKDGTEKVTSVALNYADIELYPFAEAPVEIVPGKNILTNTTADYSFDEGLGFFKSASKEDTVVLASDNGNAVAKASGASLGYHDNVVLWEGSIDRPVYIRARAKATSGAISSILFVGIFGGTGGRENIWSTNSDENGWTKMVHYTVLPTPERPITKIATHVSHAAAYVDYYDNIAVIPAYKVTYYKADGSVLSTEYVKPTENSYTVKTDNVISGSAGWTTVQGSTTKVTSVKLNYEDIDLYPAENDVHDPVPGKNILTNTAAAYTFDNGVHSLMKGDALTAASDNGNAVAKVSGAWLDYHDIITLWSSTTGIGRPVYVSAKHKATTGATSYLQFAADFNGISRQNSSASKATVDGWTKMEYSYMDSTSTTPVVKLTIHSKHAENFADYIDDVIIMPYYKVTYYNVDGSVASTVYVKPTETSYTVDSGNWTTTLGGTEKVTSVTLNYKDIDLFAIKMPDVYDAVPGKNILTNTTDAYTFDNGIHSLMKGDGITAFAEDDNAVAKLNGNKDVHDVFTLWTGNTDRPLYVGMNVKSTTGAIDPYLLIRSYNASGKLLEQEGTKTAAEGSTNWKEVGKWIKLEAYLDDAKGTDSIAKVAVHAQHADAWVDYYDNVKIIPAYKVTYHDANGDAIETVYVDPRSTTYTVKTDNVIAGTSGWATEAGEAAQAKITLNYEDIDLYPACENIHSTNGASIRADVAGIRFRAGISESFKAQPEVVAYGHIVTTEKHLANPEDLTFATSAKYVYGVSYDVNTGRDAIYEIDDKYVYFTSVLVGVDLTKTVCETKYIVRPYVLMSDGSYVYGAPVSRSMLETANNIIASGTATEEDIAAAQRIIDACK